jgi:hypothetical protein
VRLCPYGTAEGPFVHPPDDTGVNMEQGYNDTNRGKEKEWEENVL